MTAPDTRAPIKILLLENVHPSAVQLLNEEGFQVEHLKGSLGTDELQRRIADVDVIGIRSKTQLRAADIAAATRLKAIGCFCIGTNQVDLGHANHAGVPVFNAPYSNTRSVAELVISEVIALSRQLMDRSSEVHRGVWRKSADNCHEVRGKTIGIVGYGHIGSQVGVLAEAFGMRVVFYDIKTKLPLGNNRPVPTLDALLEQSDFVTLHVPETPDTRDMIRAPELARMREGAEADVLWPGSEVGTTWDPRRSTAITQRPTDSFGRIRQSPRLSSARDYLPVQWPTPQPQPPTSRRAWCP